MLNEMLKQVCVIGAAGKMGSGIATLLLQEMARLEAELTGAIGSGQYRLILIDANGTGLDALKPYLRNQLRKYAERTINALRSYFSANPALISNGEIIDYFVTQALDLVHMETEITKASPAKLIFEAIVEDVDIKSQVFQSLARLTTKDALFLTNTSSIPIHVLDEKGHLQQRLIGFHFYNPPAVQKLVELILPAYIEDPFKHLALELASRLQKIVVQSKDIAGFIGNGHFIRELLYACEKVHELSRIHSLPQSICMINKVTQDFLIRPMGIFQLIDYVGIDICQNICHIMSTYLPGELFQEVMIDKMVDAEILGGQYPDGSQKDGFFQYEGAERKAIYSLIERKYVPLTGWAAGCDKELGPFPKGHASWKHMQRDPKSEEALKHYFAHLNQETTLGAELAQAFLLKSREIAHLLVKQGVAQRIEDVDTVLKNGFFHLYGPDASWLSFAVRS